MKITKTPEGKIALILEPAEVETLIQTAGFLALRENVPQASDPKRFLKLGKKSKQFIADLKLKFGGSIVDRNDPVLIDLLFKNRISSHTQCLLTLEEKGIITLCKEGKNLKSIQLVA